MKIFEGFLFNLHMNVSSIIIKAEARYLNTDKEY